MNMTSVSPARTIEDPKKYKKEYYEKNKEEIFRKKYECDICGVVYTFSNKSHHIATSKHKNAIIQKKLERLEFLESKVKEMNDILQIMIPSYNPICN
jgi:5-methylcytosine-specific restriction endonuclease McrA